MSSQHSFGGGESPPSIRELSARVRRLYALHHALFGSTPRAQWLDVDDLLRTELTERLEKLGYAGNLDSALNEWAGTENYEMRVDGVERVDPVVLEALRGMS